MSKKNRLTFVFLGAIAASSLAGCDRMSSGDPAGPVGSNSGPSEGGSSPSTPNPVEPEPTVVWKRASVIERDLMRALSLERDQLCTEGGAIPCMEAHLAPLGGNEPFERAQYKPIAEPSSMSPLVLERVVMGACAKRVALDGAGEPRVFTHFDLKAAPKVGDSAFENALDAQHRDLFRRLLSRDPSAEELFSLRELVKAPAAPKTGAALATLGCFVVGTHAEFVFL